MCVHVERSEPSIIRSLSLSARELGDAHVCVPLIRTRRKGVVRRGAQEERQK